MDELLNRSPSVIDDRRSKVGYPREADDDGLGSDQGTVPPEITGTGIGEDIHSGSRAPTVVEFVRKNFGEDGATREFVASEGVRPFAWRIDPDGLYINRVVWQAYDELLGGRPEEVAAAEAEIGEANNEFSSPAPFIKGKFCFPSFYRRLAFLANDASLWALILVGRTEAILNIPSFSQLERVKYLNKTMKIMVEWTQDGKQGYTLSGVFTVINNIEEKGLWFQKISANFTKDGPLAIGEEFDGRQKARLQTATSLLSTAAPTTTTTTVPTSIEATGKPTETASVGGSSGLSIGAIVGIAVGGAVVLIIIITVIFCLYRRRHRKRQAQEQSGYDSQQGATVYFADKAANRGPDTPQTPYSEDGNRMPMDDLPMSSVATVNQQQPHDHIRQEQQQHHLRSASDSAWPLKNTEPLPVRSGTATPLGVSSNIVHLVEDGMTDDEIRRLEEEERHIEAAIAARRR